MKFSIITVSYNSDSTIRDTIESVLSQVGVALEYILVDGCSTDDTLSLLEPYREGLAHIVSEPDEGMYDAMNKGIARATGEVVGILNSDDFFASDRVLEQVAECFSRTSADCVYGDLHYVDEIETTRVVRNWKSGVYQPSAFKRGWHPPHPSFFVKRELYERFGGFKTGLRIGADYELMLRFLEKNQCAVGYLPEVLVKMRNGGASNRSIGNIFKANRECYQAWRMNGFNHLTAACAILRKLLSKLKQLR